MWYMSWETRAKTSWKPVSLLQQQVIRHNSYNRKMS